MAQHYFSFYHVNFKSPDEGHSKYSVTRSIRVMNIKFSQPLDFVKGDSPQFGLDARICAMVMESEAFDFIDTPIKGVTGADVITPYAANLEYASLPHVKNVERTVQHVLGM